MPVPILMYHVISKAPVGVANAELWVGEDVFAEQMRALHAAGYEAITLQQAWDGWERGGPLPRKPIVLSFDDGYLSHYTHAKPVLHELGWPGVLYLTIKAIGPGGLTEHQLRSLIKAGWELDSHTLSHPDLTTLDDATLARELSHSRRELQRRFGVARELLRLPRGPLRRPCPGGHGGRWVHGRDHGRGGDRVAARRPVCPPPRPRERVRHGRFPPHTPRRRRRLIQRPPEPREGLGGKRRSESQRRRFLRPLLRPHRARCNGEQLGPDHLRQVLVSVLPSLRSAEAVVRPDLEAQRVRADRSTRRCATASRECRSLAPDGAERSGVAAKLRPASSDRVRRCSRRARTCCLSP